MEPGCPHPAMPRTLGKVREVVFLLSHPPSHSSVGVGEPAAVLSYLGGKAFHLQRGWRGWGGGFPVDTAPFRAQGPTKGPGREQAGSATRRHQSACSATVGSLLCHPDAGWTWHRSPEVPLTQKLPVC